MKKRIRHPIVIWGTSGHASVVIDALTQQARYRIHGAIDDVNTHLFGKAVHGIQVIGGRGELPTIKRRGIRHLIVAVGDNGSRMKLAEKAEQLGFELAVVVHPRACVATDVPLGKGSVIAAGAVVNSAARIGKNVVINTGSSVDHDCVLDDGAHLAPGARLGGHAHVGTGSLIGMGALIRDRVRIGDGCIVGMGSVVTRDIPDRCVAYGNPARVVRHL